MKGLLILDWDGTSQPDSELRNQRVIQTELDKVCVNGGLSKFAIDWKLCCGHSEDNIHRIVAQNGFEALPDLITKEAFRDNCLAGFKINEPDYTPREGLIETVIALQSFDVGSIVVSNSESARVHLGVKKALEIANLGITAQEAFPVIVTKDDFGAHGLHAKPAADPYWYGHAQAGIHMGETRRDRVLIGEDSPPGVTSAFQFIHNPDQVLQFVDVGAPHHKNSSHHVTTMTECVPVMAARFDIKQSLLEREIANVSRRQKMHAIG